MELWDILDKNRRPLNKTHIRGCDMLMGEYHVVVDIWTIDKNNNVLLTLRDPAKEEYPLYWENTCGSILSGETSIDGAIRELREETGIVATKEEFTLLGSERAGFAFYDTYILRKNISEQDIILQDGETVDAKFVDIATMDKMMNTGEIALPVAQRLSPLRKLFDEFVESR